jgi:hypothetical protein
MWYLEETPGSGQDRRRLPHPSTQLRQAASCVVVVGIVGAAPPRHNCLRLEQVPDKCQRPSRDRQRCSARRVNMTSCASATFQARLDYLLALTTRPSCSALAVAQTPESLGSSSVRGAARPCQAPFVPLHPIHPIHSSASINYTCTCLGRLPRIPSRCFRPLLNAL